jgi:hypothetical protein
MEKSFFAFVVVYEESFAYAKLSGAYEESFAYAKLLGGEKT